MKFIIGHYYIHPLDSTYVYKCIYKKKNNYLLERLDNNCYTAIKCPWFVKSSKLCQRCYNTYSCLCSKHGSIDYAREIPHLKAILLYGE